MSFSSIDLRSIWNLVCWFLQGQIYGKKHFNYLFLISELAGGCSACLLISVSHLSSLLKRTGVCLLRYLVSNQSICCIIAFLNLPYTLYLSARLIGHEHGSFGLWLFLRVINKGNNNLLCSTLLCVKYKEAEKEKCLQCKYMCIYLYVWVESWLCSDFISES